MVYFVISGSSFTRLSISWYLGRHLPDCLLLDIRVVVYSIVYLVVSRSLLNQLSIFLYLDRRLVDCLFLGI
jgi:hypothetical protein